MNIQMSSQLGKFMLEFVQLVAHGYVLNLCRSHASRFLKFLPHECIVI